MENSTVNILFLGMVIHAIMGIHWVFKSRGIDNHPSTWVAKHSILATLHTDASKLLSCVYF
jgi:hypothetical protein